MESIGPLIASQNNQILVAKAGFLGRMSCRRDHSRTILALAYSGWRYVDGLETISNKGQGGCQISDGHGNARRLSIVALLLDRELSAEEIREQLGVHTSTLSQDMAKLRAVGSVDVRRDKTCVYYSSRGDAARELLVTLESEYGSGPSYCRNGD
ncbi:ArsR/SmtB family transcription factor [Mesorhizobium carmichaelinearum]|uniref:ArsR/SmtB family transcription factor n=1 Tax=Mesorhizobium carmichaelinearum TaxID=1208188 RepID=UPI00117BE3CB